MKRLLPSRFTNPPYILTFTICFSWVVISSCSDDSTTVSVVKFSSAKATYAESVGTINLTVVASPAPAADLVITYTWSATDTTAHLGGDFNLPATKTVTIKAGQTTANLSVTIVDDAQLDGDDLMTFTLQSIAGSNAKLSTTSADQSFALTIADNETSSPSTLQQDLVWRLSSATADVNAVNVDLYLQYGVTYNSTSITDVGETYNLSSNETGFETLILNESDSDMEYFIVISYTSGSSDLYYTLNLNGFGYTNTNVMKKMSADDSGYAVFYGPFTKSGSSFGRVQQPRFYSVDKRLLKGL
ncbi:MAG: hypothetical protein HYZ44_11330 [Bacteroidetes bacterium]|nr:hypothetical protein [Bacteroidota bacterium]